jgi:hypothetical protein
MEGTSHRRKRVLVVRRDYERSRLEQAQLAAAYERVLPETGVVLAESRPRAKSSTAASLVFALESVAVQLGLCATGGHLS